MSKKIRYVRHFILLTLFLLIAAGSTVSAQSTAFTFQGRLNDNSVPATGNYDFEFRLFDAISGGDQIASVRQVLNVPVNSGAFTVSLDFGAQAFSGSARFLEIAVKPTGGSAFTPLTPRQPITSTPYAIKSAMASVADSALNATNATTATNALQLGGAAANQYVLSSDLRLIDARNPLPGSSNYIQNSATPQAVSNFNISGNGIAGGTLSASVVNAGTQFNLNGSRVLSNAGTFNLFAGAGAGNLNTGIANAFFGSTSGSSNASGSNNSFFGFGAGNSNQTGSTNSFFGVNSGALNTASSNSFFGAFSGSANTTGTDNAFFGTEAGRNNTSSRNAFFGARAGSALGGSDNSFFGTNAGQSSTGNSNSFFGSNAGQNNAGINNSFFGRDSGRNNTGTGNTFVGRGAGPLNSSGNSNAFFGESAGSNNTTGSNNSALGADTSFTSPTESFSTLIGAGAVSQGSNGIVLGRSSDSVYVRGKLFVYDAAELALFGGRVVIGNSALPAQKLDVNGNIRIGRDTGSDGCIEDRDGTVIAGTCSSDMRFKRNISSFGSVLKSFSRLRPVTFYWRTEEFVERHFGARQSFGLIAQEVESLFPDLVSTDDQGFKVVNYSKLPLLTIQAVKELKTENELLRQQIDEQTFQVEQQRRIVELLRQQVCKVSPVSELCK